MISIKWERSFQSLPFSERMVNYMNEFTIGKKISDDLVKVTVNDFDDYILINPGDASFPHKFSEFVHWLDIKTADLEKTAGKMKEKYKDVPMISEKEDGNVFVDSEQLLTFTQIQMDLYKECEERINALFGQNTLKKYFRAFYEVNPDFTPDENCITDFIEEISPVLEAAYNARFERIHKKYNKNRKGRHTKTKDELIKEARAKQGAGEKD